MVAIQAAGGYFSAVGGSENVALLQGQDGSSTLTLRGSATGVLSEPDGNGGFTQEAVQVSLSLLAKQRADQTTEQISVAIAPSSDPATVEAAHHQTIKALDADFVARLAKSQIATDAKAFALLRAESPVDRASATQAAAIESGVTKASAAYQQANQLAGTAADPGQSTSGAATDIQNLVNQALSTGTPGASGSTTQDPVVAFADTLVKLLKKYVKLAGSIPTSTETAPAEAAKAAAQSSLTTAANGLQSASGTEAAIGAAAEAYAAADASEAQLYGTGGVSLDASTAAPDANSGSTPAPSSGTSQAPIVTTEVSIDSSLVPSGSAGAAAGGTLSLPPLDPRTALKLARKGEGSDIISLTALAAKTAAGQQQRVGSA